MASRQAGLHKATKSQFGAVAGWLGTIAAVLTVMAPAAAAGRTAPADPAGPVTRSVVNRYAITLERHDRPVAGRETSYTITVENLGGPPAEVTIRASLPPWTAEVITEPEATLQDGSVSWRVPVRTGEPVDLDLGGVYSEPEEPVSGPVRVAVTACVLDPAEGWPVVCDTDSGELDPPASPLVQWLLVAAVLAATGGMGYREWRRHRPAPERGTVPAIG